MAARLGDAAGRLTPLLKSFTDAQWAAPLAGDRSVGEGVQTLLHDLYVHSDDMADALGRAQWDGPGIEAALATVATRLKARGWGPATIDVESHAPLVFLEGTEPPVRVDPSHFVMIATGRRLPETLGLASDINIYQAVGEP
jgi:hypothetical protein